MGMPDPSAFDTLSPDLREDPYPLYAALRERSPIFWSDAERAWVLLGHAEASAAFGDPRLRVPDLGAWLGGVARTLGTELPALRLVLEMTLFFRNAPAHAPLRRLMGQVLGLGSLGEYATVIEGIARGLLGPLERDGRIDLVADYAEPLPPLFMGWLYGLGDGEAQALALTLRGVPSVLDRVRPIRVYRDLEPRMRAGLDLLHGVINERRRAPGDDALSLMIELNGALEEPLDQDRLTATAAFLFMAGFETTAALIGNGLYLLLRNPDQVRRARAEPGLWAGAADEALRLEPPIQQTSRHAAVDCELLGRQIGAGERLLLLIGAANRDPVAYPEPDRFLPGRAAPPALSFGAGPHACLGAGLARLEARIAYALAFVGRDLTIAADPLEWWPNQNQRRLRRLPVRAI